VFTDISEYKRAEHALNERVKELNCLYGITRIVEQPGLSLSEILQEIAQLLPGAWQYPDIAGGCIVYEGKQFVTEKFQPDKWIQTADIRVQGRKEGFVTVSYADERPERAGGEEPFLKEEWLLINAIADRLGEIIERKQAEELLKQEKEELSEFTHAMAHDLRNRLVAIEGYAALLKKGHDEGYIEKIGSLAKNMNELLYRSVTLADAGLVIEKTDIVDLTRLVQEVAESVIPDDISFRHDFLPAVRGDRHKLTQVFQNLFENAVAHGKPRKIEVRRRDTKDSIRIWITNDGTPIPSENRSKVFQRGFTTKMDGTGLGLTIAQRVIEAHDWHICLEDTPETIFSIVIPSEAEKFGD
jgi:signal transduction histidine kinase